MKTTHVFENKLREANYASLDSFRKALRDHPLCADYVCDMLVSRGVVAIRDDGSVVGAPLVAGARSRTAKELPETGWRETWPDRDELIAALRSEEDGAKFSEIQECLQGFGEPCSHWILLHAIWALTKEGVCEKAGKKYRLTAAGEAKHPKSYDVITAALKKAGAPYRLADVEREIKVIPGHGMYGKHGANTARPPTQEDVDGWVGVRIKHGIL